MTAHNRAKKEEIAKTVIMPGDPLRAKYIAEHYLEDYKLVNDVRNIYAFTGKYKGHNVTVMASGMGGASMGIYAYELFKFYDVDNIIRIGSAGAYTNDLKLFDVLLVESCYSESTYALIQNGEKRNVLYSSNKLNEIIKETALENDIKLNIGRVHSSDVFYHENNLYMEKVKENNCLAVEMESFALFQTAQMFGKQASCILTISDSLVTKEETTSEEREKSFTEMMKLVLEAILKL